MQKPPLQTARGAQRYAQKQGLFFLICKCKEEVAQPWGKVGDAGRQHLPGPQNESTERLVWRVLSLPSPPPPPRSSDLPRPGLLAVDMANMAWALVSAGTSLQAERDTESCLSHRLHAFGKTLCSSARVFWRVLCVRVLCVSRPLEAEWLGELPARNPELSAQDASVSSAHISHSEFSVHVTLLTPLLLISTNLSDPHCCREGAAEAPCKLQSAVAPWQSRHPNLRSAKVLGLVLRVQS